MPVALITLHRYASWMPDHRQGYVHRRHGDSERSEHMARFYRAQQSEPERAFDHRVQRKLVETLVPSSLPLALELYAIGTERSHLHALCGWRDERTGGQVRRSLKYSSTRVLNEQVERRTWFSRGGHVRRIEDEEPFIHLRDEYIPSHPGWKWTRRRGYSL